MKNKSEFRTLIEKIQAETEVYQVKLPAKTSEFEPVFSEHSLDIHYGTLYKNYVTKALEGEGEFQFAGAKLHTLFFEQFQKPKSSGNPNGAIKALINEKFGDFEKFKESFKKTALGIQGSGWVYLDKKGVIKTITNHKTVSNVAILIDMWEHSFIIDYGTDKEKYLNNIWKVIDWSIINARLNQEV